MLPDSWAVIRTPENSVSQCNGPPNIHNPLESCVKSPMLNAAEP